MSQRRKGAKTEEQTALREAIVRVAIVFLLASDLQRNSPACQYLKPTETAEWDQIFSERSFPPMRPCGVSLESFNLMNQRGGLN